MNQTTRLIKTFPNGESLEYDTGVFDNWCTYLRQADGTRNSPRDAEYFSTLAKIGKKYSSLKLYSDLKKIYILTDKEIHKKILDYISLVSEEYPEDRIEVEILFTILYAAFISEENKAHTKLGKRIKLLGIHQILIEGKSPEDAANFSKGMSWRDISKLCEERGF